MAMAQFYYEQPRFDRSKTVHEAIKTPTFWEKWGFKDYTPEELDEIREELNNIWHSRSKTVDTEDLNVSSLPDETLMVYDKFVEMIKIAERDKNWQKWLGRYLSADEKEDFDKMKEVLSGIVDGGVKNWSEIYRDYRQAEDFLNDYRQEIQAGLIKRHGELYQKKNLSISELSRSELVAMMANDLEKRMIPLIRCKTKAEQRDREREKTRPPKQMEQSMGPAV
jgi:hypothetical protein